MTNKTKLFSSLMVGAPIMNGVAGSMVALFDAVLVNGFGVSGVVSMSVTGGVGTANFSTAPPFVVNSVANFTGVTPSTLNGDKRVLSVAGNLITFEATGIADVTATGSIVAKVAPLGFTKPFTGTNVAGYKMADPEGTGFFLRVDDTGTTAARVRGYEVMTDISGGNGLFPNLIQQADSGLFWSKSFEANATARAWFIFGDSRGFYLFVNNNGSSASQQSYYFGDMLAIKSNDPYACVIKGNLANMSNYVNVCTEDLGYAELNLANSDRFGGTFMPRPPNTLGNSIQAVTYPALSAGLPINHIIGAQGYNFPSLVDNGLHLGPMLVINPSAGYRGYLPGLKTSPQIVNSAFNTGDYVAGTGVAVNKKVMVMKIGQNVAGGNQAVLFMDPIADWRV